MSDLADRVPELTPERRQRILDRGQARVRRNRRRLVGAAMTMLVVVVVATSLTLSAQTDHQGLDVAGTPHATADTSTTEAPTSSTSTTIAPTTTEAPTTTVAPSAPRSLVADDSVKAALREAFLAIKGLQSDEIEPAPKAGSVYYAFAPATQTYWAMAEFTPTASMTFQHGVNMQDGGDEGVFARSRSGSWRAVSVGQIPWPCPGWVPPDVEKAWDLTMSPGCDRAPVPVGGPLDLQLGADYYLYPAGWTVTPLTNFGGPASFGSAVDAAGGARIDFEVNGGSMGEHGFYNPDGSPQLDDPVGAARQQPRCPVTQWTKIDSSTLGFTCARTTSGFVVQGRVVVGSEPEGAATITITLPASDQAMADTMLTWFDEAMDRFLGP